MDRVRNVDIREKLQQEGASDMVKSRQEKLKARLKNMSMERITKKSFNDEMQGKRPRGRSRLRGTDILNSIIKHWTNPSQPIAGSTRARSGWGLCPCASCNWLLHPAPTSAQDGLDPQQHALVVFFLSPNSAKTSLALAVGITCNLHWWCFSCAN